MTRQVLVINPGSTSTKVALYTNFQREFDFSLTHSGTDLAKFDKILDQLTYRLKLVEEELVKRQVDLTKLSAVVARGGLFNPLESGTYRVNQLMKDHLTQRINGEHASNLGIFMAEYFGNLYQIPAFSVDPVVIDEFAPVARFSGNRHIQRVSLFHALNQKAVAREVASDLNGKYADFNFIVAHIGGGISVGAHQRGKVIDVSDGLNGDGPLTPERSGAMPLVSFMRFTEKNKDNPKINLYREVVGEGGLVSYLGTSDVPVVEQMIAAGNQDAKAAYEAMVYQVAKTIGEYAVVLKGKIDGIIVTGGVTHSEMFTSQLKKYIDWLGPVYLKPGENELAALNAGAQRVLNGEPAKEYLG